MSVSRETSLRLTAYLAMLAKWNSSINLVAASTLEEGATRHIDDCLQLAELAKPLAGHWIDLGSGGGLPGLIIAIALSETGTTLELIEADRRKAAFLRAVVRELELKNATVLNARIEAVPPLNAAYISARALAPLPRLMSYIDRHLAPYGKAFLMKGRQWRIEVKDARENWNFDCIAHPSRTQDGAAILEISEVKHGA